MKQFLDITKVESLSYSDGYVKSSECKNTSLNVFDYDKVFERIVRSNFTKYSLIYDSLYEVQPLPSPQGLVSYFREKYGTK